MSDDTRPFTPRESGLSDAPTGQIRAPATLTVEVGGRTDKGRVRPGNEDAFGLEPPTSAQARAHGTLLIVSDGMGGHAAGEVASNLAVDTIKATFYRDRATSPADAIQNAITAANGVIFEDAEQNAARAGMGCTIVVMVIQGSSVTVGHVGDSRGYLVRGGRARQITRDHSWVAMQVEEGVLTPEQAEHHPNRSLLMRALGRQPAIEVEIGQHQLQAGDVLILCSDGLTGVVNDAEIGEYASRYAPATAADQLVNLANQRGAPDNVTVIAAAIGTAGGAAAPGGSTTVTMSAPPADALTPRLVQPPTGAGATQPMRPPAPASSPHLGTPVVLSRESGPPRAGAPARGRRGRSRWLAGALAAFGLAAGLVLLTTLGPRTVGDVDTPRATDTAVASRPAATPSTAAQAAPAATVPPPVATGIPGLTPPGAATSPAPAAPTSPPAPTSAPTQPPAASPAVTDASRPVATPTPGTASQPGLAPLIPGGAPGILATVERAIASPPALTVPTATPTPASSGASSPPHDSAAGSSNPGTGAGASTSTDASAGAGAATATTDPSAPAEGSAVETNPETSAQETTEAPDAAQPTDGEAAAEESVAAPAPPPSAPSLQAPRFTPGAGITLPGGISIPRRKPHDD